MLTVKPLFGVVLMFASSAVTAWWAYSPLLTAKLGLIDDHEYYLFLGKDKALSFVEIPGLLLSETEVGAWGQYGHFRPLYYLLRTLETSLFGLDAGIRYFFGIVSVVIFVAVVSSLFWVVVCLLFSRTKHRLWGIVLVTLFAQVLILAPAWADIVMRLGTSEMYFVPWLAIWFFSTVNLWLKPQTTWLWVLLLLSSLAMAGFKENMIIFFVPSWILFAIYTPLVKHKLLLFWGFLSASVLALAIFLGPVVDLLTRKSDMYGQGRSIEGFFAHLAGTPYVLFLAACVIVSLFFKNKTKSTSVRQWLSSHPLFFLTASSLMVVMWEAFVYQGTTAARYAFISQTLCLIVVAAVLLALNNLFINDYQYRTFPWVINILSTLGFLAYLVSWPLGLSADLGAPGREASFRLSSFHVAENTQVTQQSIYDLASALELHPTVPVVMMNDNLSPEFAVSLSRIIWYLHGEPSYVHYSLSSHEKSNFNAGYISPNSYSTVKDQDTICVTFNSQLPTDINCLVVVDFKH